MVQRLITMMFFNLYIHQLLKYIGETRWIISKLIQFDKGYIYIKL